MSLSSVHPPKQKALVTIMEENLTRFIWKHTRASQIWILAIVIFSMIPYYLAFDLPKRIVNGPIQGDGFPGPDDTQIFLRLAFDLPVIGPITLFPGIEFDRLQALFVLSFMFLALVIVNGGLKYYINTYKGRLGERLLRRLRFTLFDMILRLPPNEFKRMKAAEVSSMVKDEVEPIGGFAGDAFVAPVFLGGQALTALVFILVQSFQLGLIALALVLVQVFLIPRLRRRLLVMGRERQLTARELGGRVSEVFEGIGTIRANDTSNYERADISARLARIFKIRFDIYQWKFLIKFLNNFLASVTPFLFYVVGGYLAIKGRLDIGELVAVIAAYKDLPGPMKELIDWDQSRQDVMVKYQTVSQQFTGKGLIDPSVQDLSVGDIDVEALVPLSASDLAVADDSGTLSLDGVNFTLRPGEKVAAVGRTGSGADVLAEVIARSVWPQSGRLRVGDRDLLSLPESISGREITYVGPDGYFFFGTVRDNLLYVLKNAPVNAPEPPKTPAEAALRDWERHEAALAGNPNLDFRADWIDYGSLGLASKEELSDRLIKVLDIVDLSRDLLNYALRSVVDLQNYPGFAERVVEMRLQLRGELARQELDGIIEPFKTGAYNTEATVIENLIFGSARQEELMPDSIGKNPYFRSVLRDRGLAERLFETGLDIARNTIELFEDLPPDHPLFQQFTLMTAEEIPTYHALLNKIDTDVELTAGERDRIVSLSFNYIEPRYRFGLLTEPLMAEIVGFRQAFYAGLPEDLRDGIDAYEPDKYIASAGLLDNLLFGRINQKYRDGSEKILAAVQLLLKPLGLYDTVLLVGLDFHIGAGGKRLSAVQRQKLGLARAILRRSNYYILNRALSALDARSQFAISEQVLAWLCEDGRNPAVLWVLSQPLVSRIFDRVLVFDQGKVVGEGPYAELEQNNSIFAELITT